MLAETPVFLNYIAIVVGLLVTFTGSYFIVKARKGTADDNEAVKTATLMTGQIAALTSQQQLAEAHAKAQDIEIASLRDKVQRLLEEKDKAEERNKTEIQRLTELVTQQAAVAQFRSEAFAWFEAIAAATEAHPPIFPEHVPT